MVHFPNFSLYLPLIFRTRILNITETYHDILKEKVQTEMKRRQVMTNWPVGSRQGPSILVLSMQFLLIIQYYGPVAATVVACQKLALSLMTQGLGLGSGSAWWRTASGMDLNKPDDVRLRVRVSLMTYGFWNGFKQAWWRTASGLDLKNFFPLS